MKHKKLRKKKPNKQKKPNKKPPIVMKWAKRVFFMYFSKSRNRSTSLCSQRPWRWR